MRKRTQHGLSWLTAISDAGSTPAASTINKVNKIIDLCCGKISELEFVPILYECQAESIMPQPQYAPATIRRVEHVFKKQLLDFAGQHGIIFQRNVNVPNMTEWRSTWNDKPLARKKIE